MNIADRIQNLRKIKGISQEELVDIVGVSRQAVSKWESEQSTPDLDKVIIMSDYFEVTTDYILKGIEPPKLTGEEKNNFIAGQILYIASTAFIVIGLLCAFGGWYEEQTAESIWGSMIIQVVGIVGYFIAKIISKAKAPFLVSYLNVIITLFMPISLLIGVVFNRFVAPYPTDIISALYFSIAYLIAIGLTFVVLRKLTK
jgi:transcriptional regulator with XRE-family HTH domain